MNKKSQTLIITIVVLLVAIAGIVLFLVLKPSPEKRCGDGICGPRENSKICLEDCPIEETCLQQSGKICSSGEICIGERLNASDTESCCLGECKFPLGEESCGDGSCDSYENPENCPEDCKEKLGLKQVIGETAVTSGDGRYVRPEVIVIDNRIFFAFQVADTFKLVELNEDLSYKSPVYDIFSGPDTRDPHDIRLATDGTNLWYAFETVIKRIMSTCDGHFLNIAKYDISGDKPNLENYELDIAKGCPTSKEAYMNPPEQIPENPEAVDDPAPIFHNGKYVVLTRAWEGGVQHIRTFDQEFNMIEDFTLDLSLIIGNRRLSQNALVDVEGQLYLIGGLSVGSPGNPHSDSEIYAIPLTNDLHSVAGDIIPLVKHPDKFYTKVNAARYTDGRLYINYALVKDGNQFHHLGVFDVNNNFSSLTQIQFQDVSFEFNHASIEVFRDRVYVFYNEGETTGNSDVLGQVFEWA